MAASGDWVNPSEEYLAPRPEGSPDAWTGEALRRGGKGSQRIIEVAEVEPQQAVAEALRLGQSETVVVRRRVILLDDHPVELVDSYFPAAIARGTGLANQSKIPGGAVTLLAQLGYRAREIREDVMARMPTAAERELLVLGDAPVLILFRTVVSDTGAPMEVTVMTTPAAGRRYSYQSLVG